jgi:hypothetical protein
MKLLTFGKNGDVHSFSTRKNASRHRFRLQSRRLGLLVCCGVGTVSYLTVPSDGC